MKVLFRSIVLFVFAALAVPSSSAAQGPASTSTPSPTVPTGVPLPAGYVIGPDDVLAIVFWRDDKMSSEVTVRPDGKISLPLLNDIQAAGMTPDQLRAQVEKASTKFIAEPTATVVVKTINSRKVHIIGNVLRPNTYPLTGEMNVLQLIALAGGLQEWAKTKEIMILRKQDGQDRSLKFNYNDVSRGKNLQQNVTLMPGDTIVVP
jgi:polysaccharide export outer membrane protein